MPAYLGSLKVFRGAGLAMGMLAAVAGGEVVGDALSTAATSDAISSAAISGELSMELVSGGSLSALVTRQ